MKISYLGPVGTFSYEATKKYIKLKNITNYELYDYKTIAETIFSITNKKADIAIVPIENSIQGSVFETMDTLLENTSIGIKEDLVLNINQNLLSNYSYNEIRKIYSHPQAIAQCRNYLNSNFPNISIIETSSTALAAKTVSNTPYSACISNITCAEEYSLTILEENIQDTQNNKTRFLVLTLNDNLENKNYAKTSIYFSTLNKPGELYKILGLFNIFNINLTKIESRPAKTSLGEYVFWIDFENNPENKSSPILLEQIKNMCSHFRILGHY